jgi:hypothetical protein
MPGGGVGLPLLDAVHAGLVMDAVHVSAARSIPTEPAVVSARSVRDQVAIPFVASELFEGE